MCGTHTADLGVFARLGRRGSSPCLGTSIAEAWGIAIGASKMSCPGNIQIGCGSHVPEASPAQASGGRPRTKKRARCRPFLAALRCARNVVRSRRPTVPQRPPTGGSQAEWWPSKMPSWTARVAVGRQESMVLSKSATNEWVSVLCWICDSGV